MRQNVLSKFVRLQVRTDGIDNLGIHWDVKDPRCMQSCWSQDYLLLIIDTLDHQDEVQDMNAVIRYLPFLAAILKSKRVRN